MLMPLKYLCRAGEVYSRKVLITNSEPSVSNQYLYLSYEGNLAISSKNNDSVNIINLSWSMICKYVFTSRAVTETTICNMVAYVRSRF